MKSRCLEILLLAVLILSGCAPSTSISSAVNDPLPGSDPCPNCKLQRVPPSGGIAYNLEVTIRKKGWTIQPPPCITALTVEINAGGQRSEHDFTFTPSLCPGDHTSRRIDHHGLPLTDPQTVLLIFRDTRGKNWLNQRLRILN